MHGGPMPASTAFGLPTFGFEGRDDLFDDEALSPELADALDGFFFVGSLLATAAATLVHGFTSAPSEGFAAKTHAFGTEVGESIAGALSSGLALPLTDGAEHVEHESTGSGACVDGVRDGEEREARGEVAVDEFAEVADAAREAIELRDDEAPEAFPSSRAARADWRPGRTRDLAERPASSKTATRSRSMATA